ncbi:MAG: hypothetical protein E7256_01985 [Lachnospiraceae bacterium]|nr:hypothetical protein [Lachnospiraceae bacterium]
MAFLNKLGDFAKNVGDKTSDMVSVNKLNLKINEQNKKMKEAKERLGDYYWKMYQQNPWSDAQTDAEFNIIQEAEDEIKNLLSQISAIKKGEDTK